MNELYEIKKEKAANLVCEMHDPSKGAIPMKCSNTAIDNERKVVKFAPIVVYCRCCFTLAIILAVALCAVGVVLGEVDLNGYAPDVFGDAMLFASIGALIGIVVGIFISIIACAVKKSKEKKRFKKFESVRLALNSVRLILVESAAGVKANPASYFLASAPKRQKGSLFLTMNSLEFYDNTFLTPYRNFLIKLTDIHYARTKGRDKLVVETAKGTYVFKLPAGKAKFWKKSINHASQYGQAIPEEA